MAEFPRNRAPRYKVAKAGTINFDNRTVDCLVRNLSETGAAMEVPNQGGIPARFELVIPGDALSLWCRVVWRKDHRMGVMFVKAAPLEYFPQVAL
jgi:hypothetical protein